MTDNLNGESAGLKESRMENKKPKQLSVRHHFWRFMPTSNNSYTQFHAVVFIITFISYALIHAVRKSFSNVKVLVAEEWTPSKIEKSPSSLWMDRDLFDSSDSPALKAFLGALDTTFMVVYAISIYLGGMLGDRIDLRYLLCGSMIGCSFSVIMFGSVSQWLGIYSPYWYISWWIVNAAFQGPIWSCLLSIMSNWFGKENRGFILGLWSSNSSVGNIVGSLMVAQFVNYGYDLAMLVPSVVTIAFTVVVFFGLAISPREVGIRKRRIPGKSEKAKTDIDKIGLSVELEADDKTKDIPLMIDEPNGNDAVNDNSSDDEVGILEEVGMLETVEHLQHKQETLLAEKSQAEHQPMSRTTSHQSNISMHNLRPVGFVEALFLPGVIVYSLSYASLKLVNYAFFFWLPFYLNRAFSWSQADADSLSTFYDFGGIVGAIVGGLLSDLWRRAPVMFAMLSLGSPTIVFYTFLPDSKIWNAAILFIIGFCIGGVANLLSSAVAADLGRHPKLNGSKQALATVSGIIDGTGSAGAAFGQLAIPLVSSWRGWSAVFAMLVAFSIICILGVGRMVWAECTLVLRCRKPSDQENDDKDEKAADHETMSAKC